MPTIQRVQTEFHLRTDLMEHLRQEAQRENCSLNNYVESVLLQSMEALPNATTMAAIKEARSSKELETLDVDHLQEYIAAL